MIPLGEPLPDWSAEQVERDRTARVATDWDGWRKCTTCQAPTGEPCYSLSGRVVDGQPDGVPTVLLEPHRARLPRKERTMAAKNPPSDDNKAPTTGAGSDQRRDDKATSTGSKVDPNRPHTDK